MAVRQRTVLVFILLVPQIFCDWVLDMKLLSFDNPDNRLADGQCCHPYSPPIPPQYATIHHRRGFPAGSAFKPLAEPQFPFPSAPSDGFPHYPFRARPEGFRQTRQTPEETTTTKPAEESRKCLESCRTFVHVCLLDFPKKAAERLIDNGTDSSSPDALKADSRPPLPDLADPDQWHTLTRQPGFCRFGDFYSDVLSPRGSHRRREVNLNLHFRFPYPWPEEFILIFEAWHRSDEWTEPNTTFIGGLPARLITRTVSKKTLAIGDGWQKHRESRGRAGFDYIMQVNCEAAFYGGNCSQMCLDRDNDFGHFVCSGEGKRECREGWRGAECTEPICRDGCHTSNGYCSVPGECRCKLGWAGPTCTECVPLPGCGHGYCTNSSFECLCKDGWDGLFCTQPMCKSGCHTTRGFCSLPGECRCRIGWAGDLCERCKPLPGCLHGTCRKPFECLCEPGWTGLFCERPICKSGCQRHNGYCTKPEECRCRVGWNGENCQECVPYPGCVHGNCSLPWECNCEPGWGGLTCNEELTFCKNENPCNNGGTCVSKPVDEGKYSCLCAPGFVGRNCTEQLDYPEFFDGPPPPPRPIFPVKLMNPDNGTLPQMNQIP